MEVVHHLQGNLEIIVSFLEVVLEAVAAFCIVLGLLVSIKLSVALRRRRNSIQFPWGDCG